MKRPLHVAVALLLLGGCASGNRYQEAIDKAYSDSTPVLVDQDALSGRTIVLDPGHGGPEPGAKGPGGLLEKDVNLAVALKLAKLLEAAGANVSLTRADDRPLTDGKSTRDELNARMQQVNRIQPDLFLSIHHNASLDPDSKADETQTYYRMEDLGPSFDAARFIHQALVKRLGLPREKLLPGNYLVLRSTTFPAVLGEASFITQPSIEKKLSRASIQEREAFAYLQGIQDYFARGVPSIEWEETGNGIRPFFTARFVADRVPVDPASIRFFLDGQAVPFYFDPQENVLSFQSERRLSNGEHTVRIEARNVLGNAARPLEKTVSIDLPPRSMRVGLPFPAPPKDGPLPVVARVVDASGYPVKDGTPVRWDTSTGRFLLAKSVTRGGVAANYLVEASENKVVLSAAAGKARSTFMVPNTSDHVLMGRALDANGNPVAGAVITAVARKQAPMTRSNADGYFWIYPVPKGLEEVRCEALGYQLAVIGTTDDSYLEIEMNPMRSAWLAGKTIVLNPLRPSDWQVSAFLEQYLRLAGANPVFSRLPDQVDDPIESVRLSNHLKADLFLTLGHRLNPSTEHYPASSAGKQLAERIAAELGIARVLPSSSYPLIHTSCTGVDIFLGETLDSARARKEAYRIFQGLLPPVPESASVRVKVSNGEKPAANASLLLNETWPGQSDQAGEWVFQQLPPGQHFISVTDGPLSRSFWVLDLKPGEDRTLEIRLDRADLPADFGLLNRFFAQR